MSYSKTLQESVVIVGAGMAGLINAHVLLQDGFSDITLISRDKSVGGTWARARVYPGLYINKYDDSFFIYNFLAIVILKPCYLLFTSVHGEYRFSSLEMPIPENAAATGSHLPGLDLCNYMEKFAEKFLVGKVKFHFETEVLDIERDANGKWNVEVKDLPTKSLSTLTFSRVILATGVSRTQTYIILLSL